MARSCQWSRTLLLFLCLAASVPFNFVDGHAVARVDYQARDLGLLPGQGGQSDTDTSTGTDTSSATATSDTTSAQSNTSTQTSATSTSTTATSSSTTAQSDTSSSTTGTSTTSAQSSPTPPPSNTQLTDTSAQTQSSPPPLAQSTSLSVDANGQTSTVVVEYTPTVTGSGASSSNTTTPVDDNTSDSSSSDISTSTIVGLSVAGGIAVIGVISFFIWKLTRKRLSDLDDEAIKWPELNQHGDVPTYALPTKSTGQAGFGAESEVNLSRQASMNYNAASGASDSSASLYAPGAATSAESYAVPPLPHLNPNAAPQPYRDDPSGYNAFYDPYRGPIPQAYHDTESVESHGAYGGESIPMSNLAPVGVSGPAAGRRSPAPPGLGGGYGVDPSLHRQMTGSAGRQSPGPGVVYTGRQSPGPNVAYGRQSPGPGAAYGGGL